MIYTVWYRVKDTNRAPSVVSLTQYTEVGEVEAFSHGELSARNAKPDEESDYVVTEPRKVAPGDLAIDETDKALIFTPQGIWASVKVVD